MWYKFRTDEQAKRAFNTLIEVYKNRKDVDKLNYNITENEVHVSFKMRGKCYTHFFQEGNNLTFHIESVGNISYQDDVDFINEIWGLYVETCENLGAK